jgi:hypothetical protein
MVPGTGALPRAILARTRFYKDTVLSCPPRRWEKLLKFGMGLIIVVPQAFAGVSAG